MPSDRIISFPDCSWSLVLCALQPRFFRRGPKTRTLPERKVHPSRRRKSVLGSRLADRVAGQELLATAAAVKAFDCWRSESKSLSAKAGTTYFIIRSHRRDVDILVVKHVWIKVV
jgi:hypothetical protein